MRKKILLFTVLFLLFTAFILVKFFILNADNNFGKLKVLSSPTAGLILNEKPIGKTSFEDKIKEGEYMLKLIPETSSTESASWSEKIRIYQNTLTYVNVDLGKDSLSTASVIFYLKKMENKPKNEDVGEIEIESDPLGAIVFLDNDEKSMSPIILSDVPKGEHELSIAIPGFFKRTEKINIEPGFRLVAKFKLAIDASQKSIDDIKKQSDAQKASDSANLKTKKIAIISDTPTGFLRVREEPNVGASESARVNPKDKFEVLEEKSGWYKIMFEKDKFGWISAKYTDTKQE